MEITTRKQHPNIYKAIIAPEMEKKIMDHFWNYTENKTNTIAQKVGLKQTQVGYIIDKHLNHHFKQINKRINK